MNEDEWTLTEPLLPLVAWRWGRGGRPEKHCRRGIVDAIRYVVDNGCKWRALPADFPPHRTVYALFVRWERGQFLDDLHNPLRDRLRERDGRDAEPSVAIIDSQSLQAAETVGAAGRGWAAGKKVNGTKRHIAVDPRALLLIVLVAAASLQDRDGAARSWPGCGRLTTASSTCGRTAATRAGRLVTWAKERLALTVEIVRRTDAMTGFGVLPRRWVVERTLAWICRRRRCVRDYERLPAPHEVMVKWSMIILMTRPLARRSRTSVIA
ncbi:IS5 family transposase [Streptomyces sp. NPDC001732]